MAFADEQSYEEMISALQSFVKDAGEQCDLMESAGNDCVDNTEDDPAATKSNERLQKCVGGIRATFDTINGIISALQEELEEIRIAAAKANDGE